MYRNACPTLRIFSLAFLLGLLPVKTSASDSDIAVVDAEFYTDMMSYQVNNIYGLEAFFTDQQDFFLPITPPAADFILNQPSFPLVIPFTPDNFPPEFINVLVSHMENSVPVYGIWMEENPITRYTIFLNENGEEIYRLAPPPNYDPFVYVKALKPDLYTGIYSPSSIKTFLSLFDPARIRIYVTLVHEKDVELYLYTASVLALQRSLNEPIEPMMMEDETDDFAFTSMRPTNSIAFAIALPEGFTNRVDIFTCNDLVPAIWTFAVKELPFPGTNILYWTDTNEWLKTGYPVRFYAAGDADTDSDGDGHADAREMMVYRTDPTNANSRPFNVSGAVSYAGLETGSVFVVFVVDSNSWSTARSSVIPSPGGFTNSEVGNSQSYWVKAFCDVNGNMDYDAWEPGGQHGTSSILFTQDTSGINITLSDVPSLWGVVSYTGRATGDIFVVAMTSSNGWDMTYHTAMPWVKSTDQTGGVQFFDFPVDYLLTGMEPGQYWIKAFIDVDGSGSYTFGDVYGHYATNSIVITNRTVDLDITLTDVDTDGDGMPDWWEMLYSINPIDPEDADADGDGITNSEEYENETNPYGEGYIADAPEAKILIQGAGIYRIRMSNIADVLDMDINTVSNTSFSLRSMGTAVPTMRDQGDVLFFGEGHEDIYTDKNAYFLKYGPELLLSSVEVNSSTQSQLNYFSGLARREIQQFNCSQYMTNTTLDPWMWTSQITNGATFSITFVLTNLNSSGAGTVTIGLKGTATNGIYTASSKLNGNDLGVVSFGGYEHVRSTFPVSSGIWNAITNTVSITKISTGGFYYVDYAEVDYPRSFSPIPSQQILRVNSGTIEIPLNSTNSVSLWDVTLPARPVKLEGFLQATTNGYYLNFSNTAEKLVFCISGAELSPLSIALVPSTSIMLASNRADYLMVVGNGLEEQAQPLASYRSTNGLDVVTLPIDTVYDVISHGRRSGESVRRLMQYIHSVWSKPPKYVVMVGDGSMDYRNYKGNNDCQIPTEPVLIEIVKAGFPIVGIYNSDHTVADCNLDGYPAFSVGRIPVVDEIELASFYANVVAYEGGGSWRTNALIATDTPVVNEPFALWGDQLAEIVSNTAYVLRADIERIGLNAARSNIFDALDLGIDMFIYIGHGFWDKFSDLGLLTKNDVYGLTPQSKPSLYLAMACNSGMFGPPGEESIGEAIVRREGVGASVIASAVLIGSMQAGAFSERVFETIYQDGGVRLGDAYLDGKIRLYQYGWHEGARAIQLLGDPGLLLVKP